MAKVSIQIRIAPDLLDWIDEKAEQEDRSRSWLINDYLRQASRKDSESRPASAASQRS
jgi:predicted transcriptional regulator